MREHWRAGYYTILYYSHVPAVNAPGLNQVVAAVSQVANQLQATEQTRVAKANARANMAGGASSSTVMLSGASSCAFCVWMV